MLVEDVAVSLKAVGGCDGTEINMKKCNSLQKIPKFMVLNDYHDHYNLPFLNVTQFSSLYRPTNTKKFTTLYCTKDQKKEIFYHLQLPLLPLHLNSFEREFCNCLNFLLIQRTTTKSTIKTQTNNLPTNQSNFVMLFSFVGVDCSILCCSALKFNIWYTYIILIKPKNNN